MIHPSHLLVSACCPTWIRDRKELIFNKLHMLLEYIQQVAYVNYCICKHLYIKDHGTELRDIGIAHR